MTRCHGMNLETCSTPSPLDAAPGHQHSLDLRDGQGSPGPWALFPHTVSVSGAGGGGWGLCTSPPHTAPSTSLASHVCIDGLIICTQPFNYPVMATGY